MFMPTWLSSTWLWLLLLVPVYFILHLFLHSASRRKFASLLLWKRLAQLIDRNQRSLPSLKYLITSLLLSVLLASVIVSVAGPIFQPGTDKAKNLNVLVDLSASMRIENDEGSSRYRRAIRRLERLADQPSIPSRWTVTLLTRPVRTLNGPAKEMIDLLAEQSVTDLSFHRSLKTSAINLLRERTPPTVLVTDSNTLDDDLFDQNTRRLTVGDSRSNTGIVSLRARRDESSLTLTIQVAHHGSSEQSVELDLQNLDGSVSASRQITLSPGDTTTTFLSVSDRTRSPGVIQLNAGPNDALASDNRVYFAPASAYRVRTRLQGGNQHVNALLASLSTVRTVDRQPDVTFYHRPSPDVADTLWQNPLRPAIVVNPPGTDTLPFETGSFDRPVRPVTTGHPIVNDLSLRHVTIRNPLVLSRSSSNQVLQPLLETDSRPITLLRTEPAPQLWMGFDPFISSEASPSTLWAIHPDTYPEFIQFWQNLFSYVQPLNIHRYGDAVYWRTGERVRTRSRSEGPNGPSNDRVTNRVGLHNVQGPEQSWRVPVNLNSRSETDTLGKNKSTQQPVVFQETDQSEQSVDRTKTINRIVLLLFLFTLILITLLHRSPAKS
jgi:hypothetical protein